MLSAPRTHAMNALGPVPSRFIPIKIKVADRPFLLALAAVFGRIRVTLEIVSQRYPVFR